ncbi:MAG: methionyl-tRNA formyltransferase [Chloroflexi bacterium]|nr:methionyl-tRNA formyltransferase [Chloroflexota bacterium]
MGSPQFALPILRALVERWQVVGVVTQPDQPAGRGRKLTPPPVKTLALELGLEIMQPRRMRSEDAMAQLRHWQPDLIVVAAFGQILRPDVLELPRLGCINVHASMLPRWRGAAPIQAAILHGDDRSGVTIMRMDVGVDTGDILFQESIPILPIDTGGSLSARLADLGVRLLVETLPKYIDGKIQPQPQDSNLATYAPMLKKDDGSLDFTQPAEDLARRVRAFNPWPGAFTIWKGQVLKIHIAHQAVFSAIQPGKRISFQGLPAIGTASGLLILDEVQPAGKKPMEGRVFINGARDWEEKNIQ